MEVSEFSSLFAVIIPSLYVEIVTFVRLLFVFYPYIAVSAGFLSEKYASHPYFKAYGYQYDTAKY